MSKSQEKRIRYQKTGKLDDPVRTAAEAACVDCMRPYDSAGFPDLIIPNWAWRRISPTGDLGGLLCPSCICARLTIEGLADIPAAFMSGPLRTVDRVTMENLRWIENLREQKEGRNECRKAMGLE